jgi:hypothetical protein
MDETALIAFGILMEETARKVLGETGDFAFVEAANDEEEKVLDLGDEGEETDVESSKSREVSVEVDSELTSDDSRSSSEESD